MPGTAAASKPERPKKHQNQVDLCRYDHARLEPSQGLMPGLYTPLPSGPRQNRLVTYPNPYGDGVIEHRCYEAFGADDLRLHLALLAMRGRDCRRLSPVPKTEIGLLLRKGLELRGDAAQQDSVTVRCTYHDLARVIGLSPGGKTWQLLKQGLKRGSADTISICTINPKTKHRIDKSYGNAMTYEVDIDAGLVAVGLHPLVARALLDPEAPYRRIDLVEMRALATDVACILHTYLSSWLRSGERQIVGLDTLATHVHGEPGAYPGQIRYRRFEIRRALECINTLPNWKVSAAPEAKSGGPQVRIARIGQRGKRQL